MSAQNEDLRPRVAALFCGGTEPLEIARKLNVHPEIVFRLVRQLIGKPEADGTERGEEVEEMGAPGRFKDLEPEILRLLREGVDPTEIAKRLKVPRSAVVYRAERMPKAPEEAPKPQEGKAPNQEDAPKSASTLDNLRDIWEDRRKLDRKRESAAQSAIDLIDDIEGRFQHDPDLAAEVATKAVEPIERAYLKLTA